MMTFTPIASSSRGNAYLAEAYESYPLLIEAGIPINKIREAVSFKMHDLSGCLVSHEHGDHSKAVPALLKAGIECYMSEGTARALGVEHHHRFVKMLPYVEIKIGDWHVVPFPLEHDASDPLGFFIRHGDERLLFIPDTAYVENRFEGITIAAIECNNISDILTDNILSGSLPKVAGHRIRRNHMNLENVIEMLKANDLSRCRQIYLLHLSDGNSDERRMKEEVQIATGIPVTVCSQ